MPLSAGMGEEVWANGLDGALCWLRNVADRLEVFLGTPALWQRR